MDKLKVLELLNLELEEFDKESKRLWKDLREQEIFSDKYEEINHLITMNTWEAMGIIKAIDIIKKI